LTTKLGLFRSLLVILSVPVLLPELVEANVTVIGSLPPAAILSGTTPVTAKPSPLASIPLMLRGVLPELARVKTI